MCDCSVANLFIPTYGGGNKEATIAWVSSNAPTKIETKKGLFTLPKYNALIRAFIEFGFDNTNSYFTHIIKCKLIRAPFTLEAMNCRENLVTELNSLPNLKIVVLVGTLAFRTFVEAQLSKYVNVPIQSKYVFIGIPNPELMEHNILRYDLRLIKYLHNITLRQ